MRQRRRRRRIEAKVMQGIIDGARHSAAGHRQQGASHLLPGQGPIPRPPPSPTLQLQPLEYPKAAVAATGALSSPPPAQTWPGTEATALPSFSGGTGWRPP